MADANDLHLDFIRQQFADLREQASALKEQLTTDTQSLTAQIRSLTGSINSNTTDILVRLTSIEAWQGSHERLDNAAQEAAHVQNLAREAEIREMAIQMGQSLGRFEEDQKKLALTVDELSKTHQQMKGAGNMWRWVGVIGGAVIVAVNLLHLLGGK